MVELQARRQHMQEIHELHESELIQIRRQMTLRQLQAGKSGMSGHSIVDKIMKQLPKLKRMHKPNIQFSEEITRRVSVLKRPFVANYVDRAYRLYRTLGLPIKEDKIVEQAMFEITKRAVIVPSFCDLICAYSFKRMTETIAFTVNNLKEERFRVRKKEFERKVKEEKDRAAGISVDKEKRSESRKKSVNFDAEGPQVETEEKDSTYGSQGKDKMV